MTTNLQRWSHFLCLITAILTSTLLSNAHARVHGGGINIEIDADTIPFPGGGGGSSDPGNCLIGQGAADSDPSLPFSISIHTGAEGSIANGNVKIQAPYVYTKSLDLKQMSGNNISWVVRRYSGVLGNPLSANPKDWVAISPNGIPTDNSPYLAVVERGSNQDFDSATFSTPFIDDVAYNFEGQNWGIDYVNDGIIGSRLKDVDTGADHSTASFSQQGCYFYGLEVTVDGITAYARTNILDVRNVGAPRHSGAHFCQIIDREGSGLDDSLFGSYEALAFEEESRTFYLLNYSDPVNATKVPVADSEAMIDIVFKHGPRLPYRYLVWTENLETGAVSVPEYMHIGMRYAGYLKYWDFSVQVGTRTSVGLVLDVFEDWKTYKFSDMDVYSWANAGAIRYALPGGTPNPLYLRPYLPEAKLTRLQFIADDLGEAETVVSEDITGVEDDPRVYNNVEHYTLTAIFTGILPVTPEAVSLPNGAQSDVPMLTKIDGVEIVLGGRKTIYVDLNRAALPDGTFMVKVSGLDPKEFVPDDKSIADVNAYISNTRWYTWAPQTAMSNFNNAWDVYTNTPTVVSTTIYKDIQSPDIIRADVAQAYWPNGTKSLILNSIDIVDSNSSFNNLLEHNIVLTVGRKGSDVRKVLDPANPFHPASYYTGRTGLNIEIDRIQAYEEWEDQEFRIAQVYFFDISSVTAESDDADRILSLTITDEDGNVTEAETGQENHSNSSPYRMPSLGVQAQQGSAIDHVTLMSPTENYLYSTEGVRTLTGVESIPDTAEYSIVGNQLTITGNGVHVHNAAGVLLASKPGTYTLSPGFYIVGDAQHTHSVIIK